MIPLQPVPPEAHLLPSSAAARGVRRRRRMRLSSFASLLVVALLRLPFPSAVAAAAFVSREKYSRTKQMAVKMVSTSSSPSWPLSSLSPGSSPSSAGTFLPLSISVPVWSLAVPAGATSRRSRGVLDEILGGDVYDDDDDQVGGNPSPTIYDILKDNYENNKDDTGAIGGTAPRQQITSTTSMNIVTSATAVSWVAARREDQQQQQKQLWIVNLHRNTFTMDSFRERGQGVLQLLRPEHRHLVRVLGGHSGHDSGGGSVDYYSKKDECAKRGYDWIDGSAWWWQRRPQRGGSAPIELLPGCAAYVHLRRVDEMEAGDDHLAFLCEVVSAGVWDDASGTVVSVDRNNGSSNAASSAPEQGAAAAVGDGAQQPLPHHLDAKTVLYTGLLREEGLR